MKSYKWIIILINLVLLLGYFNYSIVEKEELLSDGQLILLELAPVDPRSLMQGDYMTLRYAMADNVNGNSIPKRGFCVVHLDENGIAKNKRIQEHREPINDDEFLIRYTSNGRRGLNIGAESYFFQEGEAEKYENAKYGGIKVDKQGNSLLIGLYSEEQIKIE